MVDRELTFFKKVTGDSLLIHEFSYLLFISLCSVTSNMTGYSHSYYSIKIIHCGAPERDVSQGGGALDKISTGMPMLFFWLEI